MTIEIIRNPSVSLTETQLRLLYAELPTVECQQLCQDCCKSISMSGSEWDLICAELGYEPRSNPDDPTCPMLTAGGLCSVRKRRPSICRLWGVTETMQCPHGCVPRPRYLTETEAFAYLIRAGTFGNPLPKREAEVAAHEALTKAGRL